MASSRQLIILLSLTVILLLIPEISYSHVCSDVVDPYSSQYGCPDPVYPTNTLPTVTGSTISFAINVRNREIKYLGYYCTSLSEPNCYECKNAAGECGCNTDGWSATFYGARVALDSCTPSCDFSVGINPSSAVDIPISSSQNFNVAITVSPSASGNYQLNFGVSGFDYTDPIKRRQFLVDISVGGGGTPGTGGNNNNCPSCGTQSCDSSSGTCTSACSGATYCPGDSSCYFATTASGSSASCCGDDSGENYRSCAKSGTPAIAWSCPGQNACCGTNNMCVYSGSCYSAGSVAHPTTGTDGYAYCSSGSWLSCDSSSSTCSSCGFTWAGSTCCGDDTGEYSKSRVCSSGCSSSSSDSTCCSGSNMCVYNGVCYSSSSTLCIGNSVLTCSSGTWSGEDCSSKASTDNDGGCSAYTTAGTVRDFTSCSGTACSYTDYADSCSGSMLTEYCTQGSGYTSSQYDCASGNACVSNLYRVFTCSSGRCSYTDQNPDTSQAYCTGCSKTWVDNSCCGDDASEYYADICPGVTGVSRKCCSNAGDKVNSLGQCTSQCATVGIGGDNSVCASCSANSCDSDSGTCTGQCSGATYCTGSNCVFRTSNLGAAESCCGDDSGEYYKACAKASQIGWACPSQAACCDGSGKCVYSGSCYASGSVYQVASGADAYAYCSSGTWQSCDSSSSTCSSCGFTWAGSTCCGDDSGESAKSRVCSSGCTSSSSDTACCSASGNCVYNGACYSSSSKLCIGDAILTCSSGTWSGEDCSTKASTDTDGGCSAYTTAGTVRDFTSCSGTACSYTDYADSCSGSMLTEYCTQGSGYTSSQYDCASGNACVSGLYRVFSCSAGRCTYTDQNPDTSQAYCTGCSKTWVDNSCCGDDASEYYADICPGVTGVSRKCCSNSGDRVNSLGQCTGNCGGSIGTGGDNSQCSSCSTQLCDSTQSVCTGQCSGATFCSGSSCVFRTSNPGAAESCCGDDSGEFYRQCLKSTGVSWDCTSQGGCCGFSDQCIYSGNCYSNGNVHQLSSGADAYAYCSSGTWQSCDSSSSTCSSCGFTWAGSTCCGDDSGESAKSRVCSSGCTTSSSDTACCNSSLSCVYNGACFSSGTQATLEGKQLVCGNGIWSDVNQTSECTEESCNQNDGCQQCPGCSYVDYSCTGSICQPSYIDLDSLSSYCEKCSLKWSGEGQQRNCCGDDLNEHWVGTCPNVTGIAGKCCNSDGDRVNQNGECVSSCGGQVIIVNITELKEKPIPVAISIVPEAIDLEPGSSTEFKVYFKHMWNESIHNVSLYFCKEYDFKWDPPTIQELKPNEIRYFTVSMHAPENSTLGKKDFETYVTANEFLNKKQKNAILTVGKVDYTVYYVSAGIIVAIVLIVMLRKVLFIREKKAEEQPFSSQVKPLGTRARKAAATPELVDYIKSELGNGTAEGSIRAALMQRGWSKEDVDAAFAQARG